MAGVVLVGAGRMGWAMARGWLADPGSAGLSRLDVVEPQPSEEITRTAGEGRIRLNPHPAPADILVLAVKPQAFAALAPGLGACIGRSTLVLSVMAGTPMSRLEAATGASAIVRAMPNTPGAVGRGVTGYSLSEGVSPSQAELAVRLLAPLGRIVGPLREDMIDAVTAISGSGPAYVFYMVECLTRAGVGLGLEEADAALLARCTVTGAAALLEQGDDPSELRRAVTSPNGTTAAALSILMGEGGLERLMRETAEAARRRAGELAAS